MPFWCQFQKIDQEEEILPDDKFRYLLQATLAESRATKFVETYPLSSENYWKAVARLKAKLAEICWWRCMWEKF